VSSGGMAPSSTGGNTGGSAAGVRMVEWRRGAAGGFGGSGGGSGGFPEFRLPDGDGPLSGSRCEFGPACTYPADGVICTCDVMSRQESECLGLHLPTVPGEPSCSGEATACMLQPDVCDYPEAEWNAPALTKKWRL